MKIELKLNEKTIYEYYNEKKIVDTQHELLPVGTRALLEEITRQKNNLIMNLAHILTPLKIDVNGAKLLEPIEDELFNEAEKIRMLLEEADKFAYYTSETTETDQVKRIADNFLHRLREWKEKVK